MPRPWRRAQPRPAGPSSGMGDEAASPRENTPSPTRKMRVTMHLPVSPTRRRRADMAGKLRDPRDSALADCRLAMRSRSPIHPETYAPQSGNSAVTCLRPQRNAAARGLLRWPIARPHSRRGRPRALNQSYCIRRPIICPEGEHPEPSTDFHHSKSTPSVLVKGLISRCIHAPPQKFTRPARCPRSPREAKRGPRRTFKKGNGAFRRRS
jgi:hypothetical protein